MSIRNSKVYAGFKAFNGLLFVVFGAAIMVRILVVSGAHFIAVPGLVLGAAMLGLGVHRILLLLRSRT
jgi:hypothetical protein